MVALHVVCVDKMEQVFVTMYQGINVESNKETCRDLVEKIFFPPIWPNLMQIYRFDQCVVKMLIKMLTILGAVITDRK